MGTQDEVYAVLALELLGFARGADAAGEGYLFDAALAPEAVELSEVAADAVYGVLADVAGIEYDEVGLFVGLDLGVACVQDHAPHAVRVVDVHLAAEGAYARGPGAADFGCRLPGELYRSHCARRFDGLTHTLPPARRRGPLRRSHPGGPRGRAPQLRGSWPSPPA